MNIISNNCCGGFIYRDVLKQQFQNPFIWSLIEDDDYLKLINNFDTINFRNIKLEETKDVARQGTFNLIIDNLVCVKYIHMHYSKNDLKPRIAYQDVYYSKIKDKIVNDYFNRLKRMKEKPVLVICLLKNPRKLNYIKKLKEVSKKYKILLFSNQNLKILNSTSKNFFIIKTDEKEPNRVVSKNEKLIKDFLFENV